MKARGRSPKVVEAEADAIEAMPVPRAVRLLAPHAYFTEANSLRAWDAGHVEADPDEVAHLIARGAPLEHLD